MPNALPYKNLTPFFNAVKHVCGAVADVDMRTSQWLCVQRTTTGTVIPAATAGAAIIGVLQDKPNVGEEALVMDEGDTAVVAGAAITTGAALMVNATGQVIAATGTNVIVGYAISDAPGAGAVLTMHLTP